MPWMLFPEEMRYIMRLGADVIIIQFSETEMHVEHWKNVALNQETEEWQAHIFITITYFCMNAKGAKEVSRE